MLKMLFKKKIRGVMLEYLKIYPLLFLKLIELCQQAILMVYVEFMSINKRIHG